MTDEGDICPICKLEMLEIHLHFHMHDHKELVDYLTELFLKNKPKDEETRDMTTKYECRNCRKWVDCVRANDGLCDKCIRVIWNRAAE